MTNAPAGLTGMVVDLHVHTAFGSEDSDLTPPRLLEAVYEVGLDGLVIVEHSTPWPYERLERFRRDSGLFVCTAREWDTEVGHVIALGLSPDLPAVKRLDELRRLVLAEGGFLILAHPFRFFPGPSNFLFGWKHNPSSLPAEHLAQHPAFRLVDEIEVLNYACTERENQLAQEVARVLGKRGVAGSDAHTYSEVGRCVTVFQRAPRSEQELIDELRAARYQLAQRKPSGEYALLGEL